MSYKRLIHLMPMSNDKRFYITSRFDAQGRLTIVLGEMNVIATIKQLRSEGHSIEQISDDWHIRYIECEVTNVLPH